MIELKNICKIYHSKKGSNTTALKNVNLKLRGKGLTFILGKSGSGKSTLLNIIGGLDTYSSGDIIINNKSTKDFKKKDWDAYRNTYMGFIFQEYNLLENYTVEQNIKLALELQHKKASNADIVNILKMVGLEDVGKRKTNELSGGQKQRIAIARALIKNPKIILADEPTGNLDSTSSKQIFDILKKLSVEKLVIVISHDEESANLYADRIIRVSDGTIISDEGELKSEEQEDFRLINAKLPFKYSIKMGLGNLFHQKLKLLFTLILVSFSLICLGIMMSANSFDLNKEHIITLIKNKENEVSVNKYSEVIDYEKIIKENFSLDMNIDEIGKTLNISKEDVKKAMDDTKINWYREVNIIQDSLVVGFTFASEQAEQLLYYQSGIMSSFVEVNSTDKLDNLIGNMPQKSDELVISDFVADNMIQTGIYITSNGKKELYKPKSYNQILNDRKNIKLDGLNREFKIVGIKQNNLDQFEELKTATWDDYYVNQKLSEIYEKFTSELAKYMRVYVIDGFIDSLELKENNVSYETTKILSKDKLNIVNTIKYITNPIVVYDGKNNIDLSSLEENEIVVNMNIIDNITNGDYPKKLEQFMMNNEFIDKEALEQFYKDYIRDNNIIGKEIKTSVSKDGIVRANQNFATYNIVAVDLKDSNDGVIYYNKDVLKNIITNKETSKSMFANPKNEEELFRVFAYYPITKSNMISTTKYSNNILSCIVYTHIIDLVGKYGTIFFLVFSMFILINFISNSIEHRKKEIGILKALGCKSKDVLQMFITESITLLLICLFLSILGIYKVVGLFNSAISGFINNNINFLLFGSKEIIILVVVTIIIVTIVTLLPILKITKSKPIDIILNK